MPRSSLSSRAKPTNRAGAGNLETVGDKLKVFSLQNLLHAKRDFKQVDPARLGDVLTPWFEKTIAKPGAKLQGIQDLWTGVLPPQLAEHSRVMGFSRGILTIALDSAPVRAQVDGLLRGGLLTKLQVLSKGAIGRVKTQVDAGGYEGTYTQRHSERSRRS